MERLTFDGNFCDIAQCTSTPGGSLCEDGSCSARKVWERLKAYEDTGLMPEICANYTTFEDEAISKGVTFKRIVELMDADKDGRLVVLPAKTVFELTWDAGPDCDLVCPVSIDGHGCCDFCDKGELCIYERKCRQEHIEQIGKNVFLTREEAEKALEAMKK